MHVSWKDAFDRHLQYLTSISDKRNTLRCSQKLLGLSGWRGKVYSWPTSLGIHETTQSLIDSLREARRDEGLKPGSINIELTYVRRAFNYAVSTMDAEGPSKALQWKMLKDKPKSRFVSLAEEQAILGKLLKNAHENKWCEDGHSRCWQAAHDLYVVLVDTGLRKGEALGIRVQDIDFDEGLISVWREKGDEAGVTAMSSRMREAITRRIQAENLATTSFLFERCAERPVRYLRQVIHEVCNGDALTIRRYGTATVHSLRDTYASRLVQAEHSLHTVSILLGHKSMQQTRKYAHLEAARSAKEAAMTLNRVVVPERLSNSL